ncbi:MAG: hypothetical protein WCD20_15775 [Rhodomicrobium sp.]
MKRMLVVQGMFIVQSKVVSETIMGKMRHMTRSPEVMRDAGTAKMSEVSGEVMWRETVNSTEAHASEVHAAASEVHATAAEMHAAPAKPATPVCKAGVRRDGDTERQPANASDENFSKHCLPPANLLQTQGNAFALVPWLKIIHKF